MDTGIPSFTRLTYEECVDLGYTRLDASWADFEVGLARSVAKLTRGSYLSLSQQDQDCIAQMSLAKHVGFVFLALVLWLLWRRAKPEPGQLNAKSE